MSERAWRTAMELWADSYGETGPDFDYEEDRVSFISLLAASLEDEVVRVTRSRLRELTAENHRVRRLYSAAPGLGRWRRERGSLAAMDIRSGAAPVTPTT
jgi:hypothetical protein